MKSFLQKYDVYFVTLWGILLFIPFLGSVHLFDWDEVNFAESAREMLVSNNYQKVQINFQPFMEKPPLFFWLQALSMKVFGVGEFAARFPNALVGIITLLFIYHIGKRWFSSEFGFLWVILVTGSFTPHLYFKTGIIDPLYNLFIFTSLYHFFLYTLYKKAVNAWILGAFLGLAIITKGPVAVVVIVLCFLVYWATLRFKKFFDYSHLIFATISAFLVSALWFGIETLQSGPTFLIEFIRYQADLFLNPVAGHGQPFWYHPLVLLLGCFPASIFALPVLWYKRKETDSDPQSVLIRMMLLLFWVVLILFSLVETKIVHYSSLCYLPLTFMSAIFLHQWQQAQLRFNLFQLLLFGFIGILLSAALIVLPAIDELKGDLIPYIKDDFAIASLSVDGNWTGYECITGILFLAAIIYALLYFIRRQIYRIAIVFLLLSSFFIPIFLLTLAPHIERYSQGPAIRFFESHQGKDVYLETLGYKSYAQYFYGRTGKHTNPNATHIQWLLNGPTDKDAYFSLHVNNTKDHVNSSMKEIGKEGGFVFYFRPAASPDTLLKSIIKP